MNTYPKPEIMPSEHYQDPDEEGRVVDDVDIHALTQLNAAEISQQIMTARAYPRSVTGFRRSMREMVTYDQATALSCLYALKRSHKVIEGPSIRFAEAALQSWKNSRAGSRIVDIGSEFITAQGFFYDLENNMALAFEVMRRITDKDGTRYGDDMIGVTGNAASSIAFRNAVLKGIPKIAWNEPYQAARNLSIGKGESISIKRDEMVKAFAPLGVDKEQIFGLLGVKGLDDVSIDHMILMGGILNSIKEGETTVAIAFSPENMINLGEVAPRRPQRSEFERKPAETSKETPAPATKTEAASTEQKPTEDFDAGKIPAILDRRAQPEQTSQAKPDTNSAFEDWYKDQKADVEKAARVRDVADIRTAVMEQLEGYPDKEKEFSALCDARTKVLLDSTKKKSGK